MKGSSWKCLILEMNMDKMLGPFLLKGVLRPLVNLYHIHNVLLQFVRDYVLASLFSVRADSSIEGADNKKTFERDKNITLFIFQSHFDKRNIT